MLQPLPRFRTGALQLINGSDDLALEAASGEVVRFYLVNTANTRVFKVAIPRARMKLDARRLPAFLKDPGGNSVGLVERKPAQPA